MTLRRVFSYARRVSRVAERPRPHHGMRFACTRCGEWTRVPTNDVYGSCAPILCGSCIQDDITEARLHRPMPRIFGQELDQRRWTSDE